MQRRVRLHAAGRVQGVFFRASLGEEARQMGLTGWVRNLPDGRVEAEMQGLPGAVDRAIAFCRGGPGNSVVTDVEVTDVPARDDEHGFEVQ